MDINTAADPMERVRDKWERASQYFGAAPVMIPTFMLCLALDEVASQLSRIADVLQVRLK